MLGTPEQANNFCVGVHVRDYSLDEYTTERHTIKQLAMAACCPVGALPYLESEYSGKGQTTTVGESDGGICEIYEAPITGEPPTSAILMAPDVWGWNGGRVRAVADGLAEQGYRVIVGKFLVTEGRAGTDGDALEPDASFDLNWIKTFPWEVQKPKVNACLAYLHASGATKIGVMGFCYGGHPSCWASKELSSSYPIACGVVLHPSMQLEAFAFGGDLGALLSGVQCPFLLCPAGNDLAMWGEDTDNATKLKESKCGGECVWKAYPEMSHGWSVRGDLSVENVKRDVEGVMVESIAFFNKYLK